MFNPIFAAFIAAFAAPFKFDADNATAAAESPLGIAKLHCGKINPAEKHSWGGDDFALILNFKGGTNRAHDGLRENHILATFSTLDDARAFLHDFVAIQNARFNI